MSMTVARSQTRNILGRWAAALAVLAWFAIPRPVAPCCAAIAESAQPGNVAAEAGRSCCQPSPSPVHGETGSAPVAPADNSPNPACHGCPAACCGKVIPIPDCVPTLITTDRFQFLGPTTEFPPDLESTGGVFHPPRA